MALLATAALAVDAAWAAARAYTQDFGKGLAGWTSLGTALHVATGGALDNGGYMMTSRNKTFPGQHCVTAGAGTILTGDLERNFGTSKLSYSFHLKMIHPRIRQTLEVAIEARDSWWSRSVVTAGTGWTHATFSIDTDWSDAEAMRHGWSRHGRGASWKDVCGHVSAQYFGGSRQIPPDQLPFDTGLDNLTVSAGWPPPPKPQPKGKAAPPTSTYLDKVRTTLDNLIDHGRDRYGTEHSPLFAAILHQDSLECPQTPPDYPTDPVRLDPGRYKNRRAPGGGDVYFDQATLKSMDLMTQLTGDPRYRKAALDALRFALNRAVDSKGFPAIGGHMYWDFYRDRLACQGEHHELWNWPLAWDLWWDADPGRMKAYARLMWDWHVVDKTTGEINRHSDRQRGYAFTYTSASIISQWAFVASRTELEPYRTWCAKVAGFHWSRRDPRTNLFDSLGGRRATTACFTTMQATVARDWIVAGRHTKNDKLVQMGRAILDAYARYGYDRMTGLFYASLKLDGTPIKPNAERGLVTGDQSIPVGYLAIWQPHVGWQEEPLAMAQAYAWAAEEVDREAYLPTAVRFGRVLLRAWHGRYAGCKDWIAFADLLKPLAVEYHKVRGVLHSRQIKTAKADPMAMGAYRRGGYAYQAAFGMFADHYGRLIQFALSMHRLTGEERWLLLAKEVADEAVRELWRARIFVGHVLKKHYMNTDHVGILLRALLELDRALGGNALKTGVLF